MRDRQIDAYAKAGKLGRLAANAISDQDTHREL